MPEGTISAEGGSLTANTSKPEVDNIESVADIFDAGMPDFEAIGVNSSAIWETNQPVADDVGRAAESLPVFDIESSFTIFDAYPPLMSLLNTGQVTPIKTPDNTISLRAVPSQFLKSIEKACLKYIAQTLGLPESTVVAKAPAPQLEIEKRGAQCISDVAAVAVYLLTFFSGLDNYIYGIGSDVPFERIMRWRINPTLQNRQAIPEPFRPTPLQYSTLDHPVAIDFVPSPSIRDQLILKSNDSDLDQVIQDILEHTVVEVPEYRVALATLDVYMQNVLPKDKAHELESRAILAPSWTLSQYNASQVEEILVHEVSWRMKTGATACLMSGEGELLIPKFRKNTSASRYDLDQVAQWKLSKEFCDSHPDLDCSSAASSYPVVSWTSIPAF